MVTMNFIFFHSQILAWASVSIHLKIHLQGRNYWNYFTGDVLTVEAGHQEIPSRVYARTFFKSIHKWHYEKAWTKRWKGFDGFIGLLVIQGIKEKDELVSNFRRIQQDTRLNSRKMKSSPDKCEIMQESEKF